MSKLIERTEVRHINVKEQDEIGLMDNRLHSGTATLVLNLIGHNPECAAGGKLYVNGLDRKKLIELRAEIDLFLADDRIK